MSNETHLVVSYFSVGVVCLGIALLAYLWLRQPTMGIAHSLPQENWRKVIRKAFPLSTILFVLASCLSVNYYGCAQKNYDQIVSDRSYIAAKNSEQISESLDAVVWSVAVWSIVLAVGLRSTRR
jgi:hypothetical protein